MRYTFFPHRINVGSPAVLDDEAQRVCMGCRNTNVILCRAKKRCFPCIHCSIFMLLIINGAIIPGPSEHGRVYGRGAPTWSRRGLGCSRQEGISAAAKVVIVVAVVPRAADAGTVVVCDIVPAAGPLQP